MTSAITECCVPRLLHLAIVLSALWFSELAAAQDAAPSRPNSEEMAEPLPTEMGNKLRGIVDEDSADHADSGEPDSGMDIFDLPPGTAAFWDEETLARYQEAVRSGLDYRIRGFEHRSRVFNWQLLSSKLIFVAVLLLVTGGLYFAWVQFHIGLRAQRDTGEKPEVTVLSASLKGLEVTSPILGVVILVISLLFFYLYLTHVYPIQEIF